MNFQQKPLWQLQQQWERQRRARPSYPSSYAKTERNAEILWMHALGVPLSHIARAQGISPTRVRAIINNAREVASA
jgi:DNA-binding CsgD family transcriptional regulator